MPKTSLTTITVLASLALGVGCADRAIEEEGPTRPAIERSLQLTRPPTSTEQPRPIQKARPIQAPEPAISIPPPEQSADPPSGASPPTPPPAPAKRQYGCRPLVA